MFIGMLLSKLSLFYTLRELTNQIARLQVSKYLLINPPPGLLIHPKVQISDNSLKYTYK